MDKLKIFNFYFVNNNSYNIIKQHEKFVKKNISYISLMKKVIDKKRRLSETKKKIKVEKIERKFTKK